MYELIVFLPLLGSIIAGLGGTNLFRRMGSETTAFSHGPAHAAIELHHDHEHPPAWPGYLTSLLLVVCAVLSWIAFVHFLSDGSPFKVPLFRWMSSGALTANWSLRIDTLTAVMLVVVNT